MKKIIPKSAHTSSRSPERVPIMGRGINREAKKSDLAMKEWRHRILTWAFPTAILIHKQDGFIQSLLYHSLAHEGKIPRIPVPRLPGHVLRYHD